METIKRVLAGIMIVISTLGVILCLGGIIGVWVINTPLTENITGTLDQITSVLYFSQDRLNLVSTELAASQELLTHVEVTVTEAGEILTENSPTLTLLSNTVGKELRPKLETAAEVVTTIRGTIVSVNSTLETANSIPFVSVPTLPMEELTAIDQQLQEIVASAKSLVETIQDFETGVIDRTTTIIMIPVDKLSGLIDRVLTPVDAFNTTLGQVEARVRNTKARIPTLLDWASIFLTLILAWFILAQTSLLFIGWYYWKTGTIPAIKNSTFSKSSGG